MSAETLDLSEMTAIVEASSGLTLETSDPEPDLRILAFNGPTGPVEIRLSFEMFWLELSGYSKVDFAYRAEDQRELLDEWGRTVRLFCDGSVDLGQEARFFGRRRREVMRIHVPGAEVLRLVKR